MSNTTSSYSSQTMTIINHLLLQPYTRMQKQPINFLQISIVLVAHNIYISAAHQHHRYTQLYVRFGLCSSVNMAHCIIIPRSPSISLCRHTLTREYISECGECGATSTATTTLSSSSDHDFEPDRKMYCHNNSSFITPFVAQERHHVMNKLMFSIVPGDDGPSTAIQPYHQPNGGTSPSVPLDNNDVNLLTKQSKI